MRTSVTRYFSFEAAHFLPNYNGACSNLHGHSYKLHVTVSGCVDEVTGMVLDFKILNNIVQHSVVGKYDHKLLNDFFRLPTAENMANKIFKDLEIEFSKLGLVLDSVKLWETENSYAECKRGND